MTRYQQLMDLSDYYMAEARKYHSNKIKKAIFEWLANKYRKQALALTIAEALK